MGKKTEIEARECLIPINPARCGCACVYVLCQLVSAEIRTDFGGDGHSPVGQGAVCVDEEAATACVYDVLYALSERNTNRVL